MSFICNMWEKGCKIIEADKKRSSGAVRTTTPIASFADHVIVDVSQIAEPREFLVRIDLHQGWVPTISLGR
jgi:hypothetical protein